MKDLFEAAVSARSKSYSPYSGYKVGSALRTNDNRMFSGTNIENASYGATICAERVAITQAIAQGATKITEIMVLTSEETPWPPCGMCRQVIAEFATPETKVHLANLSGVKTTVLFSELFPLAFEPKHLKK